MTLRINLTDPAGTTTTEEFDHQSRLYDLGKWTVAVSSGTFGGTGINTIGHRGPLGIINEEGYGFPTGGIRIPPGVTVTVENEGHRISIERF